MRVQIKMSVPVEALLFLKSMNTAYFSVEMGEVGLKERQEAGHRVGGELLVCEGGEQVSCGELQLGRLSAL